MDLFPTSVGTRPRLACEIRPEGIVVARGESPAGTLTAVARVDLRPGLVVPGLKAGNLPDRGAIVAALRRAFDAIAARGADRSRYLTVILPDASVRVLLLDFDALPSKPAEALQVVRFRLKKLLPFDVDHALVSFQIMSTERSILRVLAVAIPHEVLAEYEAAIAEAGMQPGVVLPSTLAALAGLDPALGNALVLNASTVALTTAIVRAGVLLLHRTIDVYPAELADAALAAPPPSAIISTATSPYADLNASPAPLSAAPRESSYPPGAATAFPDEQQPTEWRDPFSQITTPFDPTVDRSLDAPLDPAPFALHNRAESYLDLGTSASASPDFAFVDRAETAEEWSRPEPFESSVSSEPVHPDPAAAVALLNTAPDVNNRNRDLAESVSVAAAYFEDTLGTLPELILAAGSIPAPDLDRTLAASGLEGLRVRELLEPAALGTSNTTIPLGWLAGLRGALRS